MTYWSPSSKLTLEVPNLGERDVSWSREKATQALFDLDPIFLHPFLILKPSPNKRRQKTSHFPTANFPKGGEPWGFHTRSLFLDQRCVYLSLGGVGRCVHFLHFKWFSAQFLCLKRNCACFKCRFGVETFFQNNFEFLGIFVPTDFFLKRVKNPVRSHHPRCYGDHLFLVAWWWWYSTLCSGQPKQTHTLPETNIQLMDQKSPKLKHLTCILHPVNNGTNLSYQLVAAEVENLTKEK